MSELAHLWPKVTDRLSVGGLDACWNWQGKLTDGYGRIWDGPARRAYRSHRVIWTLLRGPIPEGLTIDHLCRNRACGNPRHMELVTRRENVLRGEGHTAVNAAKTHCSRGHEFNEENTKWRTDGTRCCKTCRRDNERRRRAAR
jgi:hypothetical protein